MSRDPTTVKLEDADGKKPANWRKKGHSVAESMDSTLRGFIGSISANHGSLNSRNALGSQTSKASRRSRSRGSYHSRERSSSWPAGSLLLGADVLEEGNDKGDEMTMEATKETLLDMFEPATSALLDPPTWKSPISEGKKSFFGSGPNTPTNSPNSAALEAKREGKKHKRRNSSLVKEQIMKGYFLASPQDEKKAWKDQEGSQAPMSMNTSTGSSLRANPNMRQRMKQNQTMTQMQQQQQRHQPIQRQAVQRQIPQIQQQPSYSKDLPPLSPTAPSVHKMGLNFSKTKGTSSGPQIQRSGQKQSNFAQDLQMEQRRLFEQQMKLEKEKAMLVQQQQAFVHQQQILAQQQFLVMQNQKLNRMRLSSVSSNNDSPMPPVHTPLANPPHSSSLTKQQLSKLTFDLNAPGMRFNNASPSPGNDSRPLTSFSPSPGHQSVSSSSAWNVMNDEELSPRTRKKMREKERRQILNNHYNTLLHMLKPQPTNRRMEKTIILEETIAMMKNLIQTNTILTQRNESMKSQIQQLHKELGPADSRREQKDVKNVPVESEMMGVETGQDLSPSERLRRKMQDVTMENAPMFPGAAQLDMLN